MNIKELRISKGLTQVLAANLIGMELRTYQNYECGKSKRDTLKINYIKKVLEDYERINETKGILTIDELKKYLSEVCSNYSISYVYLFGSYAKGTAKETSDIDLLVDCKESGLQFLGLQEDLHKTLKKNIDLIRIKDLESNFDFLNEILKSGIKLYG